jgi:hypothetical protein
VTATFNTASRVPSSQILHLHSQNRFLNIQVKRACLPLLSANAGQLLSLERLEIYPDYGAQMPTFLCRAPAMLACWHKHGQDKVRVEHDTREKPRHIDKPFLSELFQLSYKKESKKEIL